MLEFKKPDWLEKNLGTVAERIGKNGIIQIEKISDNKVFLRLVKENGSFEILPASISLSEMVINNQVKPSDLTDYEILELTNGYICISQINGSIEF